MAAAKWLWKYLRSDSVVDVPSLPSAEVLHALLQRHLNSWMSEGGLIQSSRAPTRAGGQHPWRDADCSPVKGDVRRKKSACALRVDRR